MKPVSYKFGNIDGKQFCNDFIPVSMGHFILEEGVKMCYTLIETGIMCVIVYFVPLYLKREQRYKSNRGRPVKI